MSVDNYMNLQLANTEEYVNDAFAGNLGEVLIRCNNVLYVRGADEDDGDKEDNNGKMEEREREREREEKDFAEKKLYR